MPCHANAHSNLAPPSPFISINLPLYCHAQVGKRVVLRKLLVRLWIAMLTICNRHLEQTR